MQITLNPIGHVHSSRAEVRDDLWDAETTSIVVDGDSFTSEALRELDSFSHVEVVYFFDQVAPEKIEHGARHPRGNTEWPLVGIFAQRGKNRPNRLGVTVCRILRVHGLTIEVEGLDAVAGTPVVDIKPYMKEFGPRGDIRQPAWASELMSEYWTSSS
ncbi:SAM-dependent methyltransferase [Agreia bicolorata]|uniref:Transcriptional regulator n=1 Tax=Agreia bicolorata TaxID=110935 RepID=A0ABR5CGG3_9MICO|nr:SAM-dependent methyltransferase [Agreia bicolorata]KJC64707.1 transcriptional regulator [Agreia bicolorata]